MSRKRKKLPEEAVQAHIHALSHEGRGIAKVNDKTTFIRGALANEDVWFKYSYSRSKFDEGYVTEVISKSDDRVDAKCTAFGICGGCSLQHMYPEAQILMKQNVLLEQLEHIGKSQPQTILPPLTGPHWEYRRKARLGVKYVIKKESVLIGFREVRSNFIAQIEQCEVLHPSIGKKLDELKALITNISIKDQIPQLEVAIGDNKTVIILRHLKPLTDDDLDLLSEFEQQHNIVFYLQPSGLDSIHILNPENESDLEYALPNHDITIYFRPTDFTQINIDINRQMIDLALNFLELKSEDNVLDLFCGIGNFTLPIAKYCNSVIGVEGLDELVERAKLNSERNQITNTEFHAMDLAKEDLNDRLFNNNYNKILLDPARSGADIVLKKLNLKNVETIVYVSCNPATLARDTEILVDEKGFKLTHAGVMDMFPHTAHVESIAVFKQ